MAVALNLQEESPPPRASAAEEHDVERCSSTDSKVESKKEKADSVASGRKSSKLKTSEAEATVASLITFFDKMMNRKQLLITFISFLFGIYAIYIGLIRDTSVYGYESRHQSAHSVRNVLLAYGCLQLLLSIVFFITYAATTSIGDGRWGCQIIGGVVGCVIYLLVAFIVLVVGVVGFYRVFALYGHVEYEDRQSVDFVDKVLFKSALFIFVFHICFMLLKCCWWCR